MIHSQKESIVFLEEIEQRESQLSDWERNFVDSIQVQLGKDRKLSLKQREVISNIWNKLY